jgi:hypothetical protein
VWRTGANAATQFTTSAPITLAGMTVPAGQYTLWTVPRTNGAELIVNRQTGQWGTGYDPAQNLGRGSMATETLAPPVEQFTISIDSSDARRGRRTLAMAERRFAKRTSSPSSSLVPGRSCPSTLGGRYLPLRSVRGRGALESARAWSRGARGRSSPRHSSVNRGPDTSRDRRGSPWSGRARRGPGPPGP